MINSPRKYTDRSSLNKIPKIESYISNYQSSESIIKFILDKIITIALYEAYSKEIDKNLGEFCYDNMKKEITSFFELNFINYTTKDKKPELLWEQEPPNKNTWIEIFEPESEPMDRYESSNINYLEIKRENDEQINEKENINKNKIINKNSKKNELNNIISEVEEKSSLSGFDNEVKIENGIMPEISGIEDKSSGSLNATDAEIKKNIDNVENIENNNKNKENNILIRKEEKNITNKIIPKTPIIEELPQLTKKGRNQIMVNYPSVDIPGIEQEYNHHYLEPSNIDILRHEREEAIQKRLIELKSEKVNNKIKKFNEDNDKKPKKIFDAKHLTFDSNGNIINFKPYKLDRLKKEFTLTKNIIKGENRQESPNKSRGKKRSVMSLKSKKKESLIEDEKGKELLIEKPEVLFEEKNTRERERFLPSGSNFQIISPNIGVIIKENNKLKQGPKEFSKYFKKYSIRDYDKMLNDFVPLQNKTLLKNQLKSLNISSNNNNNINNNITKKTSNNILSNSYDNNNINNNPLLTDAQENINNNTSININNINSSLSNNNPLLSSNYNTINYVNKSYKNIGSYKSINTENSIIMKKLGLGSLKLEIESLKDLSPNHPGMLTRNNMTKNIFRYNSQKNYKKYGINNENKINLFSELNKRIMNSRDWGNDTSSRKNNIGFSENKIFARHITKQQVLRELGSNILSGIKIRLPRDRKVDINDNNI